MISARVYYEVSMHVLYVTKHKPLGPVAESPFLSLSASVYSDKEGEAVSPFAFAEKERSYYMAAIVSFKWIGIGMT